jgi:DNA repair exonuclease SbcCD ATPase subunit
MIIFKKIRFKNFLSYGNTFTEFDLNRFSTNVLIGPVGNGKTSIVEALSFVLFGKSLRRVNKPALVNNKNNKDCVVEIEFSINDDLYLIKRGIKPNIFEIYKNDILINQDAAAKDYQKSLEDDILHLSFSTFCNTVLITKQSYTSFFKFNSHERRKFIEELLSLNIFSIMAEINKSNLTKTKQELEVLKNNIKITKTKLDYTVSYIKKIQSEEDLKQKTILDNSILILEEINSVIEKSKNEIYEIDKSLEDIVIDTSQIDILSRKIDSFSEILIKANIRIEQIEKNKEELNSSDSCHSCGQSISEEFKIEKIEKLNKLLSDIVNLKNDAITKKNLNTSKREVITSSINTRIELEKKKNELSRFIEQKQQELNRYVQESQLKENEILKSEKETAKILLQEYQTGLEEKESLLTSIENLDFVYDMLKDSGIKASIIKQYLPVIINTFNSYLMKFGFNVRVDFDSELNETFYTNGFLEQSYFNYSAGEMLRIDLSMLLTWRYISKLQKNSDCNLLILDEILDASLSSTDIEVFMDIIKEKTNLNLFVISHNIEKYSNSFERELSFSKHHGFSQVIEK